MASPHSSLPSPTLSASSHHQSQSFSALSALQQPARASSALSGMSGVSHGSQGQSPTPDEVLQPQLTPQAPMQLYPGGPGFPNANPSAFLPQVTSSPPPQTPAYIPPPQHAMAPDPIHLMQSWGQDQWRAGPSQYQQRFGRASVAGGPMQQPIPPNSVDGYPRTMSIGGGVGLHNPAIQHAMMNGHRPGSAQSRRRRDRDDERDRDDDEVISTIFVVGFPDDMQEREFANLFTFASGFEAATLKFPSGSRHREPTAALLAELQQLAAMQQEHGDQQPLEEAIAALQLSGTASTSSSTTPSAAISMTPSAPNGPVLGGPSMPTRRQTIGFARFRSRAEALAAKDLLQGRKIDSLTGATLKAEMAKKNLHTKRATTSEEVLGLLLRSGRLAGLVNQAGGVPSMSGPAGGPLVAPQAAQSAKEAWDSFDRDPTQMSQARDDTERSRGPHASMSHTAVPPQIPSSSATPSNSAPNPSPANLTSTAASAPTAYNSFAPYNAPNQASTQSNASASPPLSAKSPNTRPTDSKALLALAEEADEMEGWSVGMNVGMGMIDGYQPRRPERASQSGARPIGVSMGMYQAMSGHGLPGSQQGFGAYGTSPPGGSDHMSETGRSMGALSNTNPADQNPPINTLYVGNLPAISPPTHPPNFLEESLRSLFSRCQGYKRMSFRQKINGPMCFVEFEDVPYAAQAIQDLYGHALGGLVKGGIRLSYSKNSLGQRGNAHQQGINNSLFGGIAHTVALAGMSQPTSATSPTYNTHSAPIPMPQNPIDRRTSDSTSLSPTAAPFTALSPRSRYFDNGPSPSAFPSSATSNASALGNGTGSNGGNGNGNGGGYPSFPSSANSNHSSLGSAGTAPTQIANSAASASAPGAAGAGAGGNGHLSPVASPIRTPASFAWLSSNGPMGGGGYAFEPSPFNNPVGAGVGSLNGAASAWAQGPSPH